MTIEDILEEIVGEITDEYDRELPRVEELPGGALRVTARMPVDELEAMFGVELEPEDDGVETVGGLLAHALGRVPIPGATVRVGELELVAEGARGRRNRIATVVVRKADDEPSPDGNHERERSSRAELSRPDVVVDTVEAATSVEPAASVEAAARVEPAASRGRDG